MNRWVLVVYVTSKGGRGNEVVAYTHPQQLQIANMFEAVNVAVSAH